MMWNVIAKNIGGDIETFVSMMNQKAKELEMNDSYFSNPTGLDEKIKGIYQVLMIWLC